MFGSDLEKQKYQLMQEPATKNEVDDRTTGSKAQEYWEWVEQQFKDASIANKPSVNNALVDSYLTGIVNTEFRGAQHSCAKMREHFWYASCPMSRVLCPVPYVPCHMSHALCTVQQVESWV